MYLESYLEVLTELGAAAQLAVQTLVDVAVELVRAVAAVVVTVAHVDGGQALPVGAHELPAAGARLGICGVGKGQT